MAQDDSRPTLDYARPVEGRRWLVTSLLTLGRAVLVVWLLAALAMTGIELAGVDIRENPGIRPRLRRADYVRAAIGWAMLAVPAGVGLVLLRPRGGPFTNRDVSCPSVAPADNEPVRAAGSQ